MVFQSTLPMRGATRQVQPFFLSIQISIHTPHAGSDLVCTIPIASAALFQSTLPMRGATMGSRLGVERMTDFNPHSPCGERLVVCNLDRYRLAISIHTPHAGSDQRGGEKIAACYYFNPHSPCGERLCIFVLLQGSSHFNPHSPCGERRLRRSPAGGAAKFQSTLPMRGATHFSVWYIS